VTRSDLFEVLVNIALFGITCGTPLNVCDDSVVRQRAIDVSMTDCESLCIRILGIHDVT
jgi:hypothetical protein